MMNDDPEVERGSAEILAHAETMEAICEGLADLRAGRTFSRAEVAAELLWLGRL
ncbi:hypothetical protein [Planomonospora algeriensis]